jgi:hypothetical protein
MTGWEFTKRPLRRWIQIAVVGMVMPYQLLYAIAEQVPAAKSYELDVRFEPEAELSFAELVSLLAGLKFDENRDNSVKKYPFIQGTATMQVELGGEPVDTLDFYMNGELRAGVVKINDREYEFSQKPVYYRYNYSLIANQVSVDIGGLTDEATVYIEYAGFFHPSLVRGAGEYTRIEPDGIYLRSYGYSLWFPVLLEDRGDPFRTAEFKSVNITTPQNLKAVFTGRRVREFIHDGLRTSEWTTEEVPIFAAQCTARPYEVSEKDGIFIYHMPDPKSRLNAEQIRDFSSRLLKLFAQRYRQIQENPQYHIAEMPNFASDISSGNMIGLTSQTWHNFDTDEHHKTTIGHEYVHPFVMPLVARTDPLFALGLEGFPSYFHLPVIADLLGEPWYRNYMSRIEKLYLQKKETGQDQRGNRLPTEKPLYALTAEDVSTYKDTFLLNDRARLFLNYLLHRMGRDRFWDFTRELFSSGEMSMSRFKALIEKHLPGSGEDVRVWLEENDYPERFHLDKLTGPS